MSHNTSALTLNSSGVDIKYNTTSQGSFDWSGLKTIPGQGQPVGENSYISPIHLGQYIKFFYNPITVGGNYASIHFETNVVWRKNIIFDDRYITWSNLSDQHIQFCYVGSTQVNIENQSLSYAQTSWNSGLNNTLTIYGDVTLSGLTNGATNQEIFCTWGSSDTTLPFFDSEVPNQTYLYVEQNPSSIVFSTNLNDALLSQQIAQQEVMIQLQNEMNDRLDDLSSQSQQNTQDIIDNQNQNTQDIIRSNQRCATFNKSFDISDINVPSKYLDSSGSEVSSPGWGIIKDVEFYPNLSYDVIFTRSGNSPSICQYSGSKELISCIAYAGRTSFSFTSASNAKYFSLSILNSSDVTIRVSSEQEYCTNFTQEYNDKQYQAWDNISNQSSSDIQGSSNQQTTNLIGIISSFVSALTSINTNGSCQLTLPFPSLLGGDQVVNPCNGADKAPAIISVASSLLLITIFVPLAFILIKMIYNEIRSFTNG